MSITARNEERALFAKKLNDIGIGVGLAFHAAYNDDANAAADQLEEVLEGLNRLAKEYATPLSETQS